MQSHPAAHELLMVSRVLGRVMVDDYQAFIGGLCGMPPGPDRDECVRYLARRLLALYAEYRVTPPPGLRGFAERIGITTPAGFAS